RRGAGGGTGGEARPGRGARRDRGPASPAKAGAAPDGVRESAAVPGRGPRQRAAGGAGRSPRARRAGPGIQSMSLARYAVPASLLLLLAPRARAELVDRIAAVVNNDIITLSEVEKRAAPELARVSQEGTGPERAQKRAAALKRTLDTLIDEKLVDNELKELKVSIGDKEVDAAVDEVKKSYNLNDDQLRQAVSREGYSIAEYRESMRKQIGRYKLISEKVRKNVKVSEADVKTEYERMTRAEGEDYEVHIRHILIAVPRTAPQPAVEQARRKALAGAAEARQPGVAFAALAQKRSP